MNKRTELTLLVRSLVENKVFNHDVASHFINELQTSKKSKLDDIREVIFEAAEANAALNIDALEVARTVARSFFSEDDVKAYLKDFDKKLKVIKFIGYDIFSIPLNRYYEDDEGFRFVHHIYHVVIRLELDNKEFSFYYNSKSNVFTYTIGNSPIGYIHTPKHSDKELETIYQLIKRIID